MKIIQAAPGDCQWDQLSTCPKQEHVNFALGCVKGPQEANISATSLGLIIVVELGNHMVEFQFTHDAGKRYPAPQHLHLSPAAKHCEFAESSLVCTQVPLCRENGDNDSLHAAFGAHSVSWSNVSSGVSRYYPAQGGSAGLPSHCTPVAPAHDISLACGRAGHDGPTAWVQHLSLEISQTSHVTVLMYSSKICFFQVNGDKTWLLFGKIMFHALVFAAGRGGWYWTPHWPSSRGDERHFPGTSSYNATSSKHAWCLNGLNIEIRNIKPQISNNARKISSVGCLYCKCILNNSLTAS